MPSTGSDDKPYLTVREYAESRRLNPVTVYRLVADGRLEAERYGRAIRIPAGTTPTAGDS
jgi:excisionase family DNA binding protein